MGIISLVCLNLPPNICYRSKHMCLVGIIPGPHEPLLTTLNHYLTLLVDNFLDFWDPGMRFSQMDGHKNGRLVHCTIVCLVCDLLAARKTSGLGPISHSHFCAICHCTHQNHGYGAYMAQPLLRLSTMLRPNQNRTQHLLLAASNGQSCFIFHILIQPSLLSLMPCIIYSLASSTNISKIYWVFALIMIKRRAAPS